MSQGCEPEDEALLDAVSKAHGTAREHDTVLDTLHAMHRAEKSERHINAAWARTRKQGGACLASRKGTLGWDVVLCGGKQVLQTFPGPAARPGSLAQGVANAIVCGRTARRALRYLEAFEAGGAARARAVGKNTEAA